MKVCQYHCIWISASNLVNKLALYIELKREVEFYCISESLFNCGEAGNLLNISSCSPQLASVEKSSVESSFAMDRRATIRVGAKT